ncbi:Hypothetical predicted protein [Mytilus galloprovincialis]|uniref:Uncharacterized protein n=1 Tax=Mytilus galloprovincialis TaxID=29158 RepID=A0A8B6DQC4_MYTGA|nr:Hypothetical predicted protein [Mytilus galloprovincialis]
MIIVPSSNTLETLRQLNTDIDSRYKNFCRRSEEYKSFITRADTNESQQLISDYNEYFVTCVSTYRKVNSEIKKKKADLVEQLSQVSSSNGSSKASSKRAKAEAEKVRLELVRKEGELMKQKAAIEADIHIVKQESKVAAGETEVRILEQGDQEQDIISEVCEKKDDISNYVHNVHFQEPVASWLNQQPNIPVVASSASQAFSAAKVNVSTLTGSYIFVISCNFYQDAATFHQVDLTTNSQATYPFPDCDKQYPSQMLNYSYMQQMMTENSTEKPTGAPRNKNGIKRTSVPSSPFHYVRSKKNC